MSFEKGDASECAHCGRHINFNGFSWVHTNSQMNHLAEPKKVEKVIGRNHNPVTSLAAPFLGEITTCEACGLSVTFNGSLWTHYFDGAHEFTPVQPSKPRNVMSVRELLTGDVNRLRYITRHSTSLVLHRENVAEHSYYVALYSMFICEWVRLNQDPDMRQVDELDVLRRCLVHDLDESRTGDFQRPFKHNTARMKNMLDEAALAEFATVVENIIPSKEYIVSLMALWRDAKSNDFEGMVVAFADYLSVVSYLCGETGSANYSVMKDYRTMQDYTATFLHRSFDFIRPLVDQTKKIVDEMIIKAGV